MATADPVAPSPAPDSPPHPTEAARIKAFAAFFKSYMSVSSVLLAALPIPVTQLHLIPTFKAQEGILSVYTSLFCFLIFSFIFFWRHSFARWMFPLRSHHGNRVISRLLPFVPLALIAATIACIIVYHTTLASAVHSLKLQFTSVAPDYLDKKASLESEKFSVMPDGKITFTPEFLMQHLDADKIPNAMILMLSYIGIFLFAESAFSVMALKEYLQDLLHQDDLTLIKNREIDLDATNANG
jgi:hypothetical protein